jgi:hypothetical protein
LGNKRPASGPHLCSKKDRCDGRQEAERGWSCLRCEEGSRVRARSVSARHVTDKRTKPYLDDLRVLRAGAVFLKREDLMESCCRLCIIKLASRIRRAVEPITRHHARLVSKPRTSSRPQKGVLQGLVLRRRHKKQKNMNTHTNSHTKQV